MFNLSDPSPEPAKHLKCKGRTTNDPSGGYDHTCDYNTTVECGDCRYGPYSLIDKRLGKDPAAKRWQIRSV